MHLTAEGNYSDTEVHIETVKIFYLSAINNTLLLFFSLESGKPTIVHCSLIVESFGNIEEANMVCIIKYQFTVIGSLNLSLS